MINLKDIVTIKIPYPDTLSDLAKNSHMYICIGTSDTSYELVKCQSFKPYHSFPKSEPIHRIIENSDTTRNPFRHITIIDLDKIFIISQKILPDSLKITKGVCDELYNEIKAKLSETTKRIILSDAEFQALNRKK